MSLPEHANDQEIIKSPGKILFTAIATFVIVIVLAILLFEALNPIVNSGAKSVLLDDEVTASRIQPVAGFKLVDADAPVVLKTGEQVYESTCSACHGAGVAGAPKFGDEGSWASYIKQGYEDLLKNAINGIGAMPPRGGNSSLSDLEVARAVVYMANHSGADFAEPSDDEYTTDAAADDAADADTDSAAADDDTAAADDTAEANDPVAAALNELPDTDNELGKKIYASTCITCHSPGLAGAPKFGDKEAWAPYAERGMDTLLAQAIAGVGAMPPRGGTQATDEELKAAIEYMLDAAK